MLLSRHIRDQFNQVLVRTEFRRIKAQFKELRNVDTVCIEFGPDRMVISRLDDDNQIMSKIRAIYKC